MLRNRPFWITLALLAAYLLAGYFAGPYFLQPRLKEFVSNELGRELDFAALRFDPITFSAKLQQVSLLANERSLWPEVSMQAEEVHVRFNFWRLHPAVSDLLIIDPTVKLQPGAEQLYPFISHWHSWRTRQASDAESVPVPIARWRVEGGRLAGDGSAANTEIHLLLDDVYFQVGKAGQGGLRELGLAFTAPSGVAVRAQGLLDATSLDSSGEYQLAASENSPGRHYEIQLTGDYQAGFEEDILQVLLGDSQMESRQALVCWDLQLLCMGVSPLLAGFEARLQLGTDGIRWQDFRAGLQAFQLHPSLGKGSVELYAPLDFSSGTFELQRLPSSPNADSVQAGIENFEVKLNATGDLVFFAKGGYDASRELAELQIGLRGEHDLDGFLRLQNLYDREAYFSQMELQVDNPAASLAREFMDQHLGERLEAAGLGLQLLASQGEQDLELLGQVSLAKPVLRADGSSRPAAVLDTEWLLGMLQDPQGNVELELPQLIVDPSRPARLSELLGPAVLERLQESSEQPFSYLAGQVGAVDLALDEVVFAAGSAATHAQSNQVINALGTALTLRPGLSLEVPAVYDPLIDRKALQTEQVRTHIALAGAAEPSFQSGAEPTDFSDAVVHSVIDEFARQRLPAAVLAGFFEHFGEADVDQGIAPE
ncbi:MAG TPA: hypothetical protein VFG52_12935, partial [Xanthomonadales bacterium]|nr:hypothetical protein [Xanthomonadales bacterium]